MPVRVRLLPSLLVVAALAAVSGFLASACVSSMECRQSSHPVGGQQCVGRGGGLGAVATAAAAGIVWATVGCRANGCNLPYTCNQDTGLCERIRCSEGHSCPPAYDCDYERSRCE